MVLLAAACTQPEYTDCRMGLVELGDSIQRDRRDERLRFELRPELVRGSLSVLCEVGCSWWEKCNTHEVTVVGFDAFPASYMARIPACDDTVPRVWSKLLGPDQNRHVFFFPGRLEGPTCFRALSHDLVPGPVIEVNLPRRR